jgi:hypothetical protein
MSSVKSGFLEFSRKEGQNRSTYVVAPRHFHGGRLAARTLANQRSTHRLLDLAHAHSQTNAHGIGEQ